MKGPGHFLGHQQTLGIMETEYIYPVLGDRLQPTLWEELGSQDIRDRARARVREVLSSHYPGYIDPAADAGIRSDFDIRLPEDAMRADSDRW